MRAAQGLLAAIRRAVHRLGGAGLSLPRNLLQDRAHLLVDFLAGRSKSKGLITRVGFRPLGTRCDTPIGDEMPQRVFECV
jgi:hypothetical protein